MEVSVRAQGVVRGLSSGLTMLLVLGTAERARSLVRISLSVCVCVCVCFSVCTFARV